ncbi:riboflavin kinase / FMN adenylyltransferase [Spiroplasma chinense]|uniref:riboflavin kinase n=1 Tax=Spiroplasma chinense TaxID=216932 RepID=A0A5B9Y597_9MOLU|nr:riboflavin kinase [Spiroplasma chinense]QEH61869.1 riboflavin kinase / FMN adenylyltransferase [Spiroplasma chinense]
MTTTFTYNNMTMIMLYLDESIALVGDFENWNEFEDKQIERLKEIANKKGLKTTLFVPIKNEIHSAIWNQNNIQKKAEAAGVDYLVFYIDHQMMRMNTDENLFKNIDGFLKIKEILIAQNYCYKQSDRFNFDFYRENWKENCHIEGDFYSKADNTELTSLLKDCKFDEFKKLTNLNYQFSGRVVQGKQLGRTIGFPTINVVTDEILPISKGVFAVDVYLESTQQHFMGAGCYWKNEMDEEVFETFILDFDKDVYGWKVDITLIEKIRDNLKINSLDELKETLANDVEKVRKVKPLF